MSNSNTKKPNPSIEVKGTRCSPVVKRGTLIQLHNPLQTHTKPLMGRSILFHIYTSKGRPQATDKRGFFHNNPYPDECNALIEEGLLHCPKKHHPKTAQNSLLGSHRSVPPVGSSSLAQCL